LDCPFPWATSLRRSNESKAYSETTMAKRKPTKADLEARAQMRRNADRLRELAEQGKRDLDARGQTER
jgi:hypothetical protein